MIYADNNATSPLKDTVKKYLVDRIENGIFANPNSLNALGLKQNKIIKQAREICAKALGARTEQVLFTSGASESISTIFYSLLNQKKECKILSSQIEHSAVMENICFYKELGHEVSYFETNHQGITILSDEKFQANIDLACLMAVNNETGVLQPWLQFSKKCQEQKIKSIVDTTQLIGKAEFDFSKSEIDFACLSGHKLGALIGGGILLAKDPELIIPLIKGGGQENGKRSGTQNFLAIETLAIVLSENDQMIKSYQQLEIKTEEFEKKLKKEIPEVIILGDGVKRIAGTSLIGFRGILGQAIVIELESRGIFVSTSSACSDNDPETSKVLKAMNVDDSIGRSVVRISLSKSDQNEYEQITDALVEINLKLKKISHYNWN